MPSGHNIRGDNILIITPVNNTKYSCVNSSVAGEPYYVFVAGKSIISDQSFPLYKL